MEETTHTSELESEPPTRKKARGAREEEDLRVTCCSPSKTTFQELVRLLKTIMATNERYSKSLFIDQENRRQKLQVWVWIVSNIFTMLSILP